MEEKDVLGAKDMLDNAWRYGKLTKQVAHQIARQRQHVFSMDEPE
jgi:hypothetical protein